MDTFQSSSSLSENHQHHHHQQKQQQQQQQYQRTKIQINNNNNFSPRNELTYASDSDNHLFDSRLFPPNNNQMNFTANSSRSTSPSEYQGKSRARIKIPERYLVKLDDDDADQLTNQHEHGLVVDTKPYSHTLYDEASQIVEHFDHPSKENPISSVITSTTGEKDGVDRDNVMIDDYLNKKYENLDQTPDEWKNSVELDEIVGNDYQCERKNFVENRVNLSEDGHRSGEEHIREIEEDENYFKYDENGNEVKNGELSTLDKEKRLAEQSLTKTMVNTKRKYRTTAKSEITTVPPDEPVNPSLLLRSAYQFSQEVPISDVDVYSPTTNLMSVPIPYDDLSVGNEENFSINFIFTKQIRFFYIKSHRLVLNHDDLVLY
ncbi:hypothetical protein SNEBB_005483 [Seison nebaliae]|nr:hypothetical protein SNEBB_005483 [Seison nebaliae]